MLDRTLDFFVISLLDYLDFQRDHARELVVENDEEIPNLARNWETECQEMSFSKPI